MITATSSGSFNKTLKSLTFMKSNRMWDVLRQGGQNGREALRQATPIESGETANSWGYRIINKPGRHGIEWFNTHFNEGVSIALLIQYGHGTGTGGYVHGVDYINPAMRPVFDKILDDIWRQVRNA